jgi:hypothetical protein
MGEWMYRSTYSWPRHWLEVSSQIHPSAAFSPGKELLVPTGQEAGWAPEQVRGTWRGENPYPYRDSNSKSSAVQSVASRYADWAIPAPITSSPVNGNAVSPLKVYPPPPMKLIFKIRMKWIILFLWRTTVTSPLPLTLSFSLLLWFRSSGCVLFQIMEIPRNTVRYNPSLILSTEAGAFI